MDKEEFEIKKNKIYIFDMKNKYNFVEIVW